MVRNEDEDEMKDKVNEIFDLYDSAPEQLPKRLKSRGSSSVKRLKPQSYQPLNKFSPPPKKKINHFQIPKNINPLQAIEFGILRASKLQKFKNNLYFYRTTNLNCSTSKNKAAGGYESLILR